MPVHSLVRILGARADKMADVLALEKSSARSYLVNRILGESDIDDPQLTASLSARIGNVPELYESEGDRERRAHCRAHDRAGVSVDSARDLDGDDRQSKYVKDLHHSPRRSL